LSLLVFGSKLLRSASSPLRSPNSQERVLRDAKHSGEIKLHDFCINERTFSLVQILGGVFRTWHLKSHAGHPIRDACQLLSVSGKLLPVSGSDHAFAERLTPRFSSSFVCDTKASLQMGFCLEPWYGNFYHWLIWCAPRLLLLHRTLGISNFFFPVGAIHYPFIVQTMVLLGLNIDAITEVPVGFHPTQTLAAVQNLTPHPSFYSLIAKRAFASSPFGGEVSALQGYYLTRRHDVSNPRELFNEDLIMLICQQHGIIPIDPASLDLAEQIRQFSSVPLLVGIHGAALSNMVWMSKGSQVLEIMVGDAQHFRCLAGQVGHRWLGIPSESISSLGSPPRISVNPEIFKLALEMALCQL
jgi:hypothetical protein